MNEDLPQGPKQAAWTGLEADAPSPRPSKDGIRKFLGAVIGGSCVLAAAVLGIQVTSQLRRHPQSRDGVVSANIVGIAPRVNGPILRLHIRDHQRVRKGELLFEIDPEPFEWAVKSARASIAAVDGELLNAKSGIQAQVSKSRTAEAAIVKARTALQQAADSYQRMEPLGVERFLTAEALDEARSRRDIAAATLAMAESDHAAAQSAIESEAPLLAKRAAAEASLGQAELALRDCTVRAPFDGWVVGLRISPGAFAAAGHTVVTLIDESDWHVEANFLESDLTRIQAGAPAEVEIMTDPGKLYRGRVESIGGGVSMQPELPGSTSGAPVVRRELDWVRLSQRFPVRIRLDPPPPEGVLKVGAVVTATIRGQGEP